MKNKVLAGKGLTLIELTVVIVVIVTITTFSAFAFGGLKDWQKGRAASEQLRAVNVAQRIYLSDFPNTNLEDLTPELLIPYLPNQLGAIPEVESLEGDMLEIDVTSSPPTIIGLDDSVYDPSDRSDDSLWDVGKQ